MIRRAFIRRMVFAGLALLCPWLFRRPRISVEITGWQNGKPVIAGTHGTTIVHPVGGGWYAISGR